MDQRKSLGSSRAQWGSMEVSGTQCGSVRLAGGPWDRDFRHEKVNVDVAILIRIVGYSDEDNLKVVRQKCQSQNGGNKKTKHAKFSNILGEEGRVRNICFSKNLARFAFLLHPF